MKLPNADKAIINKEKITSYILSFEHFEGRHKARVFASALGLNKSDATFLINEIRKAILREEAVKQSESLFGEKYVVDFDLEFNQKVALIRTAWIIEPLDNIPRFITCFIKT